MADITDIVKNHDILMRLERHGIETHADLIAAEESGRLPEYLGDTNAAEISRRIHDSEHLQ